MDKHSNVQNGAHLIQRKTQAVQNTGQFFLQGIGLVLHVQQPSIARTCLIFIFVT